MTLFIKSVIISFPVIIIFFVSENTLGESFSSKIQVMLLYALCCSTIHYNTVK